MTELGVILVPPEFISVGELQRRAADLWHEDAELRIHYLLATGELTGFLVFVDDAEPKAFSSDFWKTKEGRDVFRHGGMGDPLDPRIMGVIRMRSEISEMNYARLVFHRDEVSAKDA